MIRLYAECTAKLTPEYNKHDRGLLFLYLYLLYSPGNDHDQAAADVVRDVQRLLFNLHHLNKTLNLPVFFKFLIIFKDSPLCRMNNRSHTDIN